MSWFYGLSIINFMDYDLYRKMVNTWDMVKAVEEEKRAIFLAQALPSGAQDIKKRVCKVLEVTKECVGKDGVKSILHILTRSSKRTVSSVWISNIGRWLG